MSSVKKVPPLLHSRPMPAKKKDAVKKKKKTRRKPGRPRKYTNARILWALRHKEVEGLVYLAADKLECDPGTIYDRANEKTIKGKLKNPAIANAIKDSKERRKDKTELKLYSAIDAEEPWAIRFFLLNQARDRGYGERLEIDDRRGKVGIRPEDLSDQELADIAALGLDDRAEGSG